jgi:hypothetical protein
MGIDTHEAAMSEETGAYSFDAQTVRQSLVAGQGDIFTPLMDFTIAPQWTEAQPVQWRQADFYRVAQAVHQLAWQEPLEDWKIKQVFFRLRCAEAVDGPQFMSFDLFKIVRIRQANSRLERRLNVELQRNQVSWSEGEYYPERFRWPALDLMQIKIQAEQALQIAETFGGGVARWKVEDRCVIFGTLAADAKTNSWLISYSGNIGGQLFDIRIDGQTGKTQVIYPNPR